jgi:hypothetical protein
MSQSSLSIPNEAGASFRADNNAALQALASLSAGTSAPATSYAYQPWADTTNGVLKQRNAANSGWIIRDTLAETRVISRSSNTILGLGDYGCTFIATSTFTQTLTAAATLGDGWHCFYRNDGSGVITIDPNSTETIDGGLVLTLNPGEGCRIVCNGSAFKTQGLAWKIAKRKTADESVTSSTTLQDDDHLLFPIGANEEWVATFEIDAGAAVNTTGFQTAITAPAGATLNASGSYISSGGALLYAVTTTSGNNFIASTPGAGATAGIHLKVWVLNGGTPGNVTLQWAQNALSGTALTFKKGSFLQASRVA